MQVKNIVKIIVGIVLFIMLLVFWPLVQVDAGERGVVLRFGEVTQTLNEGLHFINPFTEEVEKMSVRTQKVEVGANAASSDVQDVTTTVALNFNIMPDRVADVWTELKRDYQSVIVDPAIQEAVKAGTAKFTAVELVTKRDSVKEEIKNRLKMRLAEENMFVSEVSMTNFKFSPKFEAAIEAKVTAEQEALAAKNKLEQVKFEAQQQIEKAKAEAETTRLQAEALRANVQFIEFKNLEVQMEYAKKWDGKLPVNIYSGAPIPFIDVNKAN